MGKTPYYLAVEEGWAVMVQGPVHPRSVWRGLEEGGQEDTNLGGGGREGGRERGREGGREGRRMSGG